MKKLLISIIAMAIFTQGLHAKIADGTMIYGACIISKGAIEAMVGHEVAFINYKTCLIPVIVAGVGKELYDANHDGHTAEVMDALATIAIPVSLTFVIYEW